MPTHEEKAGFAQRHEITTKQVRPIYTSGSPRLKCWIVCCSQEGSVFPVALGGCPNRRYFAAAVPTWRGMSV